MIATSVMKELKNQNEVHWSTLSVLIIKLEHSKWSNQVFQFLTFNTHSSVEMKATTYFRNKRFIIDAWQGSK